MLSRLSSRVWHRLNLRLAEAASENIIRRPGEAEALPNSRHETRDTGENALYS
jgi:hypothetical protein